MALIVCALAVSGRAAGQADVAADDELDDLTHLSLEELMDVEVTSVTKRKQRLRDAAAAIHVITQEDLRRTGATSIPEALRMVPGLQVSQINNSTWALSARGYASQFSNKLLVLVDGRSIYTPLYAGVYWDAQDLMLEDVERIEIIRGPGGALWGANAVNGVINIITKSATDTIGGLGTAAVGTELRFQAAGRYSFELGDGVAMKLHGKFMDRDTTRTAADADAADDWDSLRAGVRIDSAAEGEDVWTLDAGVRESHSDVVATRPLNTAPYSAPVNDGNRTSAGHLLGRWTRTEDDESSTTIQAFADIFDRDGHSSLRNNRYTLDLDMQHTFAPGGHHRVMVGLGYRYNETSIDPSSYITATSSRFGDNLWSGFFQDEITLSDRLTFTVGTKVEHNDYTGWEFQPDARLRLQLSDDHTVWASVARSIRTPTILNYYGVIDLNSQPAGGGMALVSVLSGNPSTVAEELIAAEIGYRGKITEGLQLDIVGFVHEYDDHTAVVAGTPFLDTSVPRMVVPLSFTNDLDSETYGVELSTTWQVSDTWRLYGAYSFLALHDHILSPAVVAVSGAGAEGASPRNQVHLRSSWTLPDFEFDLMASYIDNLPGQGVPSFVRIDARAGWSLDEHSTIELVGQNLLDDRHPEFGDQVYTQATEIERGAYIQMTTRF